MDAERKSLIQKLIEEGNDRHTARRELISQGFSSDGYDQEYEAVLKELNVPEPVQKVPPIPAHFLDLDTQSVFTETTPLQKWLRRIVITVFVVALLIGAFVLFDIPSMVSSVLMPKASEEIHWGEPRAETKQKAEEHSFSDSLLEAKVESTVASANVYGGRMGSYDGVCKDITVVAPVACKATYDTFVIYTPLSDGTYFCVDNGKQRVSISAPPPSGVSCQ